MGESKNVLKQILSDRQWDSGSDGEHVILVTTILGDDIKF